MSTYRNADRVVFHCALSQVRGPKAANRFRTVLEETLAGEAKQTDSAENGEVKVPEIYVLRGGFSRFQEEFGDHKDLVENLTKEAKEAWANGYI